jgi:hypothetical protein
MKSKNTVIKNFNKKDLSICIYLKVNLQTFCLLKPD